MQHVCSARETRALPHPHAMELYGALGADTTLPTTATGVA